MVRRTYHGGRSGSAADLQAQAAAGHMLSSHFGNGPGAIPSSSRRGPSGSSRVKVQKLERRPLTPAASRKLGKIGQEEAWFWYWLYPMLIWYLRPKVWLQSILFKALSNRRKAETSHPPSGVPGNPGLFRGAWEAWLGRYWGPSSCRACSLRLLRAESPRPSQQPCGHWSACQGSQRTGTGARRPANP